MNIIHVCYSGNFQSPFETSLIMLVNHKMCLCVQYSVHVYILYVYVCLHVPVLNGSSPAFISLYRGCFLPCHNSPCLPAFSCFLWEEHFIIKGFLSREIFDLFFTSLTASRHLQSKDEICVDFIKEYIVDCNNLNLSFINIPTRGRDTSGAWHAVRTPTYFVVCWHGGLLDISVHTCHALYTRSRHC